MRSSDKELGMGMPISRRDFINGIGASVAGGLLPGTGLANGDAAGAAQDKRGYYPPTLTGLRGNHEGSFEVAHARARNHLSWPSPSVLEEYYDLVVVGAGISGLSAAYRYAELAGTDARILVLDNHDDFGGHAKRNEFHYQGQTRLAWGGAINLEYPHYSKQVSKFLAGLGVDIPRLAESFDFRFSAPGKTLDSMLYLDKATFGEEARIRGFKMWAGDSRRSWLGVIDQLPMPAADRDSLRRFLTRKEDLLAGMDETRRLHYLRKTSYLDFITTRGGVTRSAARVLQQVPHGLWGVGIDALDVANCLETRLPGYHAIGALAAELTGESDEGFAMFPDGNASIARMLVRSMVPAAAPGNSMQDIVCANFDYARLDQSGQPVRIRLNATAVQTRNVNLPGNRPGVAVDYVRGGK
ncbi:MAG: NAD(P)/FAD-dependent oxidoreductase, partial [Chromatiales bacterium]|nr:NAD(P)/FAD-dependent oxidoreductase [Chromatiales bacterium]